MNPTPASPSPEADADARQDGLQWLAEYGDALFAYAVGRVESTQVAEELVQETFLAAVRNHQQFQQRSAPKTWLLSILRHKLMTHYRQRHQRRAQSIEDVERVEYFDGKGNWKQKPSAWNRGADDALETHEFWQVFQTCLSKLPGPLADIFVLRVLDELKTESICKTLKITAANFAVRMHRARLALRACLGKNWFEES